MNKIIIFSHESDIDGLGSIVLGNLAFKDIDYELFPNTEKLELKFREYIEQNKLDNYDKIYITDLALYDPSLTMVANSNLKDKVLVFDHHKASIDNNMNRYNFTKIVEEDEQGKRCGTNLFYEYLIDNKLLKNTLSISQFVESTTLEDTWEWKKHGIFGIQAHNLSLLFNKVGIEEYIRRMVNKLEKLDNKPFIYDQEELLLIKNKYDEYQKELKKIIDSIEYYIDEYGNKFGVVYANYEYRNEIAEYIISNNNPQDISYIIIVALDKGKYGQKSYRSIIDAFDVNKIAIRHGGGGHPGAAMVNITPQQKAKALLLTKREGLKYLADSIYQKEK